jgi:dsRNA-specific ribonuclease
MVFRISVFINNQLAGTGEGTRKIMAEEHAARDALSRVKQPAPAPEPDGPEDGR